MSDPNKSITMVFAMFLATIIIIVMIAFNHNTRRLELAANHNTTVNRLWGTINEGGADNG